MPALVTAADLTDYPGAPFAESLVESAAESVRDEAGWHIAPEVTETIRVFSTGGTALILPTLEYSVTAVRDVSGDTPETLTEWTDRGSGILLRSYWPHRHMLEVDLTHGYATCPPALLSVIAERCQRMAVDSTVSQMSRGPFSVSIRAEGTGGRGGAVTTASDAILARYTVTASP